MAIPVLEASPELRPKWTKLDSNQRHGLVVPFLLNVFLAINPYSTLKSLPVAKQAGALTAMLLAQVERAGFAPAMRFRKPTWPSSPEPLVNLPTSRLSPPL